MSYAFQVRTDKDVDFTGTLAQNAGANVNLTLPGALAGINGNARSTLKSIAIISDENLDWEVWLFGKSTFQVADYDSDFFVGRWSFVAADAVRIAGTGGYYYYIEGLGVPYADLNNTGKLHITLINRSAAGKSAGASGEVVITFTMEPM